MTKMTAKRNKKEEQKKLAVRIVCLVLVAALAVTSLLTMFPTLFQSGIDPELQAMIDAGYAIVNEDGSIQLTQAYIDLLTAASEDVEAEAAEGLDGEVVDEHEGHNHD